jgi:hypothetical protein
LISIFYAASSVVLGLLFAYVGMQLTQKLFWSFNLTSHFNFYINFYNRNYSSC